MPGRNSKGQFVRGGGKKGKSRSRKSKSMALVRAAPVHRAHHRRPHHAAAPSIIIEERARHGGKRRGGRSGGAGVTLVRLVGAGLVLGSAAETNSGPLGATVYNAVQKLPGVKTFGGAVTAGLYLGALSKTRLGRGKLGGWLKAAGVIGVAGAVLKIGAAGTKFQWLGGGSERDGSPFQYGR